MVGAFRFDCVFYYVSDLNRAIAFYTRVLGFSLSSRDVVARFMVNGLLVELIPTNDQERLCGQGNARLTLVVDDLHDAIRELTAKGVRVSTVTSVSNGRMAFLSDPDGNELALWQYA